MGPKGRVQLHRKRKKIGGKGLWAKFLVRLTSNINARPERHELVEKKLHIYTALKKKLTIFVVNGRESKKFD